MIVAAFVQAQPGAGSAAVADEAMAEATRFVDLSLAEFYEKGMTAERLNASYLMFGEDPFIVGGPPKSDFSPRDYARGRCDEICGGRGLV